MGEVFRMGIVAIMLITLLCLAIGLYAMGGGL